MKAALTVGALVRLCWAILLPFNRGPDENAHLQTIRFFAEHGLPTREQIFSATHFYIAASPAPYAPNILLELLWHGAPLLAHRMVMVLLGVSLMALGYGIVKRVKPELAVPFVWLLALQPQLAFHSAYLNWDLLTFLAATLVVSTWPDLGQRVVKPWHVGAYAGLVLLMKPTGFAVLPVLLGLFIYARPRATQWLRAAAACALVAAPFLLHNNAKLPGDPFGFKAVLGNVSPDWPASVPGGWAQLFTTRWAINSFESTWALFGMMSDKMPNVIYVGFAVCTLIALVRTKLDKPSVVAIASVTSSLLLAYATSAVNDFQPQGRYFFASVVPLFALYIRGAPRLATYALCVLCLGIEASQRLLNGIG